MNEKLQQFDSKMKKTCEHLEADFVTIRAGRANPHVLDKIKVNYYGSPTPIQQVGNITVPEPRMIQIAPWEKSLIKEIEKAIMASDVGITPSNDGNVIRLVFPEVTEERRKALVKEVKKKGEEGKVAIRNIRRDGNDTFKKMAKEDVSEDEINAVVDALKEQGQPEYHSEILKTNIVTNLSQSPDGSGGTVEEDDPLIWEAADIVVSSGLGSTSNIQRRLKVGYSRAGRIMDMLEEHGVVGPPNGSKPREVLVDAMELETLKAFEANDAAKE